MLSLINALHSVLVALYLSLPLSLTSSPFQSPSPSPCLLVSPSLSCTHTAANGNAKVPKYLLDAVNGNCSRFIRLQHAARTERSFVCPSVLPSVRLSACPSVSLSSGQAAAAKCACQRCISKLANWEWVGESPPPPPRLRLRLASTRLASTWPYNYGRQAQETAN